jgi:tetratricopeptide (TPR) repeat protein
VGGRRTGTLTGAASYPACRSVGRLFLCSGHSARAPGVNNRFDIAVHYFLRREYERAVREFRDLLRDRPDEARTWSYYGICLAHLGRAAEAEAALARAISLAPANEEAWFHLGIARSLREEWEEAASAYRHAVALAPEDLVAWHRLGVALAEAGEETAASVAFERALVLSREVPEAKAADRATGDDHLEEKGEREGAREAKSWIELALSLLSLGEEEEALAAYERAVTLDPERAQRSLFPPMLRLVTTISGGAAPPEARPPLSGGPVPPVPGKEGPRPRRPRPDVG